MTLPTLVPSIVALTLILSLKGWTYHPYWEVDELLFCLVKASSHPANIPRPQQSGQIFMAANGIEIERY